MSAHRQRIDSAWPAARSTITSSTNSPQVGKTMMDTSTAAGGRKAAGKNAITIRMGAVALILAIVLAPAATAIHQHKEDVMNDPVIFLEYAHNGTWITVHFAQWLAAMLLFGGLLGVHYAIKPTGLALGLARFGAAAAVQAAAAITALQVVDGVALKWAVDAWAAAPQIAKTLPSRPPRPCAGPSMAFKASPTSCSDSPLPSTGSPSP
jgi:hypothetical protein